MQISKIIFESKYFGWAWWLTSVIPTTWEVEIEKIFLARPGKC
jgi:hypothetical protein